MIWAYGRTINDVICLSCTSFECSIYAYFPYFESSFSVCISGLLCAIPPLNVVLAVYLRRQIRIQYNISGSVPKDIIAVILCPFCTLIQESQQLTDQQIVTNMPSDMVIERDGIDNQITTDTPS